MEQIVASGKQIARRALRRVTPYLRQLLRFCALPYCYLATVNWAECTRSRAEVAGDMLFIFFDLGYYPDNYGKCRLWGVPRERWRLYYGSGYNPFQRALLSAAVQRPEYKIIFHDKQVAQLEADSRGIPMPRCHGYLGAGESLRDFAAALPETVATALIAKPVLGAAGRAIYLIDRERNEIRIRDGKGDPVSGPVKLREQYIVQSVIEQHPDLARVNDRSLNTLRMLTLIGEDGRSLLLSAFVRFGRGTSVIDNWSAGGVAVGVDLRTGRLHELGLDKHGTAVACHATSGVPFADVIIPMWDATRSFATSVQSAFPFYRMLGLDVAVTPAGPMLVEINPSPDLVLQEQTAGPLLADVRTLEEFARQGLLTRGMRRHLADDLRRVLGADG